MYEILAMISLYFCAIQQVSMLKFQEKFLYIWCWVSFYLQLQKVWEWSILK